MEIVVMILVTFSAIYILQCIVSFSYALMDKIIKKKKESLTELFVRHMLDFLD